MERAKIKFSEKKIFRSQETHNIPSKKNSKAYLCKNFFQILEKNAILPGNLSILCNMVVTNIIFQNLSQTTRK